MSGKGHGGAKRGYSWPPFEKGNTAAGKHLAHSEPTVRRVATVQKRRLLRQIGLRQTDLDRLGAAYLDGWARAQAKVELMDAYADERGGWLDGEGNPPAFAGFYFRALDSARRSLDKLSDYLKERNRQASIVVEMQGRKS